MDIRSQGLPTILLLALGIALPAMTFAAYPQAPNCCTPSSPGYQIGDLNSLPGLADQDPAGAPNASGESFPNSPFNLGEGAPAQSGSSFAANDAPNMIGDLLLNTDYVFRIGNSNGQQVDTIYSTIALAGGDRRFKISENMSPLPRDRIYYGFNGFQQAARTIDNREIDVNRHTLGGEKTFWNGLASLELRMPILQGLSALQARDGNLQNDDGVEFGNLTLLPKFIINDGPDFVFSVGLGINLPTALDASFTNLQQPFLRIHNEAVHLSPFLGLLWLPTDNMYVISFVQADFAANGNQVTDGGGNRLGTLHDQNLLYFDVTLGRFLYRDAGTRLSGIAAQLELHYTTTLQDAETLPAAQGLLGNPFNRLDLLILTGGLNFQFWNASSLTVGCAVPVRGARDPLSGLHPERPFDVEIQVLFNRYF
jgi:hypothetical protein